MEENLQREKKVRADVEKAKRKVESDLKMTQEAVEELEKVKADLEGNVRKWVSLDYTYHCTLILVRYKTRYWMYCAEYIFNITKISHYEWRKKKLGARIKNARHTSRKKHALFRIIKMICLN